MPAPTVTVADSASSEAIPAIAAHLQGEHGLVGPPQWRHTADHAGAAAERDDGQSSRGAQLQHRADLLVGVRIDDCVGRSLGRARAQSDEVRIALAGGVQDAFVVVVANVTVADDRRQLGARGLRQRRWLDRDLLQRDGRSRHRGGPDVLVEKASGVRREHAGMRVLAPAPPAHRRRQLRH